MKHDLCRLYLKITRFEVKGGRESKREGGRDRQGGRERKTERERGRDREE